MSLLNSKQIKIILF